MNSHTHDHTPAPDAGDAMPSYYEIMETSGLLRGCLTEKKSLVKIGEPSHMSTRFFATRFFQMPARGRGGKSEGAKKHHASSRRSFFSDAFRGRGGNLEVTKKHHAFSGGRRYRGFATLPPLAINTDPPIFSHEHTIFRDAVFPDVRARTW